MAGKKFKNPFGNYKKTDREAPDPRETFKNLHGMQRVQFIWDYYKLQLLVICIVIYAVFFAVRLRLTHKDTVLYAALVNVSAGEDLTDALTGRYLAARGTDPAKNTCTLYSGLYLTDDENSVYHEYVYASRMKLLAAIDGKELDLAIMDQEAFDAFSQNGYLCDLDALLKKDDPALYATLQPYLVKNISILEDNSFEVMFDDTLEYDATTEEYTMGIDLSASPLFEDAGFGDKVYLGVLANSPRMGEVWEYLRYLCGEGEIKAQMMFRIPATPA